MKKADLVSLLANKHKLPRNKTQDVVEDLFAELALALQRGELIDLRGFGTFSVRVAKERRGRNLHTGEAVPIPSRRIPSFRPGKELLGRCNSDAQREETSDESLHSQGPNGRLSRRAEPVSKTL